MNLLIAFDWKAIIPLMVVTIMGLCIVPLITLMVSHIFTHLPTMLAGVTLGPHIQGIVGGIGSLMHELIQIIMAFLTGHDIRYAHILTIQDFKRGHALGDVDHNWPSNHYLQSYGDFLLGTVPFFVSSYVIMKWQGLLSGSNPFTFNIAHMGLSSYESVRGCLSILFFELHSAFSGLNLITLIIFIIGLYILGLYGLNTTVTECGYATHGTIMWIALLILLDVAVILSGLNSVTTSISMWVLNFTFFAMSRAIVYAIVLLIPIAILKAYSKVKGIL